jgi:WWE domain
LYGGLESTARSLLVTAISVKIKSRMSETSSDQPVWQRFSNGNWHSFGDTSSVLELEFRGNSSSPSAISGYGTVDFGLMISITSNEPIRRLSSKETPDVIYEWEDSSYGNRIWSSYNTDDCEAISISQQSGRSITTIYVGRINTPYEINFQRRTQTNKQTNNVRWIRKVPQILFTASPSAMAPDAIAQQQQVRNY